jgi:hypothetical protein
VCFATVDQSTMQGMGGRGEGVLRMQKRSCARWVRPRDHMGARRCGRPSTTRRDKTNSLWLGTNRVDIAIEILQDCTTAFGSNQSTIPKISPQLIVKHSLYTFRTFVKAMPEQKTKALQDDTAIVCLRRLTAPLRLRPDRMRSTSQMQQAVSIPLMARHAAVL